MVLAAVLDEGTRYKKEHVIQSMQFVPATTRGVRARSTGAILLWTIGVLVETPYFHNL